MSIRWQIQENLKPGRESFQVRTKHCRAWVESPRVRDHGFLCQPKSAVRTQSCEITPSSPCDHQCLAVLVQYLLERVGCVVLYARHSPSVAERVAESKLWEKVNDYGSYYRLHSDVEDELPEPDFWGLSNHTSVLQPRRSYSSLDPFALF